MLSFRNYFYGFWAAVGLILVAVFSGCSASRLGSEQDDRRVVLLENMIAEESARRDALKEQVSDDYEVELLRVNRRLSQVYGDIRNLRDSLSTMSTDLIENQNEEIAGKEEEIILLQKDSVRLFGNKKVEAEVAEIDRLIDRFKTERTRIMSNYASDDGLPKELSETEEERRQRSLNVRSRQMLMEEIQKDTASGELRQGSGFKVILDNQYSQVVTFKVTPLYGGDHTSVALGSRQKQAVYLPPGDYQVTFLSASRAINSMRMTVSGKKHIYQGESCFAFAYMPER